MAESDFNPRKNIQELYNLPEKCILQANNNIQKAGKTKKSKGNVIQNTIRLIERRSELYCTRDDSEINKLEYTTMDKITKRKIRKDIRENNTSRTRQILETSKSIKKAKKDRYREKQWMLGTKDSTGAWNTTRQGILESATDYYKSFYTSSLQNSTTNLILASKIQDPNITNPPILISEVRTAIDDLKNGKTPG